MKAGFIFDSWTLLYNRGMDTTGMQLAHILRRTSFGIRPGQIDQLRNTDVETLIDEIVDDEGWALSVEEAAERGFDQENDEWDALPMEWLDRMIRPDSGLHERMVWYWHGHFTTNRGETGNLHMWRQHHLVRRNALGNFRDFCFEILHDGAMLHFLDGDGSYGDRPNENLSREFMELFTLGRNAGYTEDDIRAGARILSGFWVDWETGEVHREAENTYDRPVRFLGTRKRWTMDDYVDAILELPAAAEHVVTGLHDHFVSTELTDARRSELAGVLRSNKWELRPLMREMFRHPDFLEARGLRTRQPVEWLTAAALAFGWNSLADSDFEYWQLYATGQAPFEPPNVAGWPDDDRWSSATQVVARANAGIHWELPERLLSLDPTPEVVLAHCGIFEPSEQTHAALRSAIANQPEYDRGLDLLITLALISPEFATC
jgi:uncharacterized protein (DUF1800 family)